MDISFRLATIADLSRVAEINGSGEWDGEEEAKKELPRFIEKGHLACAEIEGKIVALLYWEESFFGKDNWFLTQITVDQQWRRKGIGEALWKYFLILAKKGGAKRVFCDVRSSNIPSINLAQKIGALRAGILNLGDGDERQIYRIDL